MKDKPIILKIEEFKGELSNSLNELLQKYQIPMYFVNNVIDDIHTQINTLSQTEYRNIEIEYNKKEENKDVENKE